MNKSMLAIMLVLLLCSAAHGADQGARLKVQIAKVQQKDDDAAQNTAFWLNFAVYYYDVGVSLYLVADPIGALPFFKDSNKCLAAGIYWQKVKLGLDVRLAKLQAKMAIQ